MAGKGPREETRAWGDPESFAFVLKAVVRGDGGMGGCRGFPVTGRMKGII